MTIDNPLAPSADAPCSAWAAWARSAADERDWQAALERWDACIRKFGTRCEWQAKRATALLELGQLAAAEQVFKELANDAKDSAGLLGLAQLAIRRQDWSGALSLLERCRTIYPRTGTAAFARVLLQLGRADEAEQLWSQLRAENPDNAKFRLMELRAAIEGARRNGIDSITSERFLPELEDLALSTEEDNIVQTVGLLDLIGERGRAGQQLLRAIESCSSLDYIALCFRAVARHFENELRNSSWERLLARLRTRFIEGKRPSPQALNIELRLLLALGRHHEFAVKFDTVHSILPAGTDLLLLSRVRERLGKPRHEIFAERKVFGIGLTKTGTTSLSEALTVLGIDAAHWANPLTHQAISDVDIYLFGACSDTCISSRFEQLYYLYPNAVFVWTRRDVASWRHSYFTHQARNNLAGDLEALRSLYDSEDCPFGLSSAIIQFGLYLNSRSLDEAFWAHERRVRHFFSDKPAGKLLELDLFGGQGWPELCNFLDRPAPDRPFPWANRASSREVGAQRE